jgi:hypothetical protein
MDHVYKLLTLHAFALDVLTYKIIQPMFLKVETYRGNRGFIQYRHKLIL